VFPVSDVQQTLQWYSDVLGFRSDPLPADKPVFAILRRDGVEIMVRQDPSVMRKNGRASRWNAYIRLDGHTAASLFDELKEKARVLLPIEKVFSGQTEFEIEDCNGYVLCFAEAE
jgi:uncharacterized glyoxalase superfamily protein PhnB